eukprot:c16553_g1_i1 orf=97-567(-)
MQGTALLVSPAAASTCRFALTSIKAFQNARPSLKGASLPLLSSKQQRRPLGVSYAEQPEQDYIVYDDKKSVFPAEACEELGGDACQMDGVGPEVKGSVAPSEPPQLSPTSSGPDREYVDYKESKTVFPGEACDDLGGEFCEPEYQSGVFPEKVGAK